MDFHALSSMVVSVIKAKKVVEVCVEFYFRKLEKKTKPRMEFNVEDVTVASIVIEGQMS